MPLRWHVNLPGPVAYSRPIRRKGKKPGPLTSVLVWFIVKPLELTFRGGAHVAGQMRSRNVQHWTSAPVTPVLQPGWYDTSGGPIYWNGSAWYGPDGQSIF